MEQERRNIIRFPVERRHPGLEKSGQVKLQEESAEGNPTASSAPAHGGRESTHVQQPEPPRESALDRVLKKLQEEPPEDADKNKIKEICKALAGGAFYPGVGLGDLNVKIRKVSKGKVTDYWQSGFVGRSPILCLPSMPLKLPPWVVS